MKLLMKYFIILIPIFSFSQINEDFLTTLFIDSTKIQNQEFKLDLAGFINTKGQKIKTPYGKNQYVIDDEDNYFDAVIPEFILSIPRVIH